MKPKRFIVLKSRREGLATRAGQIFKVKGRKSFALPPEALGLPALAPNSRCDWMDLGEISEVPTWPPKIVPNPNTYKIGVDLARDRQDATAFSLSTCNNDLLKRWQKDPVEFMRVWSDWAPGSPTALSEKIRKLMEGETLKAKRKKIARLMESKGLLPAAKTFEFAEEDDSPRIAVDIPRKSPSVTWARPYSWEELDKIKQLNAAAPVASWDDPGADIVEDIKEMKRRCMGDFVPRRTLESRLLENLQTTRTHNEQTIAHFQNELDQRNEELRILKERAQVAADAAAATTKAEREYSARIFDLLAIRAYANLRFAHLRAKPSHRERLNRAPGTLEVRFEGQEQAKDFCPTCATLREIIALKEGGAR